MRRSTTVRGSVCPNVRGARRGWNRWVRGGVLLAVGLVAAPPLAAQDPPDPPDSPTRTISIPDAEFVDRLVAVAGDSAILYSQLQDELLGRQAQGAFQLPTDPDSLMEIERQVLDEMVDVLLIVQAAARDTLIIPDEDQIQSGVDTQIQDLVTQFGGRARYEQELMAAGWRPEEYRRQVETQLRKTALRDRYVQRRRQEGNPPLIEAAELRAYYEENREQLGQVPDLVTVHQVVIPTTASEAAHDSTRAIAEGLIERLEAGESFADLATEFSQDPGSAAAGGDLGWYRRGGGDGPAFDPDFEDGAFELFDGMFSDVVETQFGYHIIKRERTRGPEIKIRHILLIPEVTDDDVDRASILATEVRRRLLDGESIEDLAEEFTPEEIPTTFTFPVEELNARLDGSFPGYAAAIKTAEAGDILGPISFVPPRSPPHFGILRVTEIEPAHDVTYEEAEGQLRNILAEERFLDALRAELRSQFYVQIMM